MMTLPLCLALVDKAYSPRKSGPRDSKGIAIASDFAEPLTLSAFPVNETKRKICCQLSKPPAEFEPLV